MSIKLEVTKDQISNEDAAKVHFIPATVSHNGIVNIDEYFNTYSIEENGVIQNSLRGYPLRGLECAIPENLLGMIFRENDKLKIDNAERTLKCSGKFQKFIFWNYDKNPSENDCYKKIFHYLELAQDLHSEVASLEEI